VNNKELFYKNPQMKPALFGLRGAWCATGVEYNFPNSHSTTTLEPVMTKTVEHEDGSASFICGDCERVGRMLWSMEVTLRTGSACIEMKAKLYNCTEYPKRFYYWLNAAVPIYGETQFIYPESTKRLFTHPPMDISRIAYLDYPVHKGRDISTFKNIPQHFPVFAEEMQEDFFGIYHHHLNYGLVHLADHSLVRGRKIWMFGTSRDGKMWTDRLTDSGIDYCEIQSGPFSLQSDYRLMPPGKMHIQKDVWIPVGDIGGFNAASEKIAANILREKGKLHIKLSASCDIPEAFIAVTTGTRCVYKQKFSLSALEGKEFMTDKISADYHLEILDADGRTILSYSPEKRGRGQNLLPSGTKNRNRYLEGSYWEEQGWTERAYGIYSQDSSIYSKIAAARMDMDSGLYEKALESMDKVLLTDRENSEALLYSGICLKNLGDYREAEKRFSAACDNASFIGGAVSQMAQISIIRKDYGQALQRLEHLRENKCLAGYNCGLYLLALRKNKKLDLIPEYLLRAEEDTPFEPLAMGESFFNGKDTILYFDCQIVIEILCRYINLKEYGDALEIVSFFAAKNRNMPALAWYYRAYLEQLCGRRKEAEKSLRRAAESSCEWDFIFRDESAEVLKYALSRKPGNSEILYHMGNYYARKRRWNEALGCWRKVKGSLSSFSLRNEGLYLWKIAGEAQKALPLYKKAASAENCGARTLWEYDKLLSEAGDTAGRMKLIKKHGRKFNNDYRLLLRKTDALLTAGQPEEALEILEKNIFSLCEGKLFPRLLFEEACRQIGEKYRREKNLKKALEYFMKPFDYPENLSVGKPAANMECEWYWLCGTVCKEAGDNARAREFFRKGTEKGHAIEIDFFPLKKLIWQHDSEIPDPAAKRNETFRSLCFKMHGKNRDWRDSVNRLLRTILPTVVCLSFAGLAYGWEKPAYPVYLLETEPVMDGKVAGDIAWKKIPSATGFLRFGTQEFSANQTSFKIGHTAKHIYAAIEVYDVNPLEFKKKDSLWKEDLVIEIFFAPRPGVFYQFAVTPFEQKWCMAKGAPEISVENWDVKSGAESDSCSLEIKMPLNIFSPKPAEGELWGLNVGRSDAPGKTDRYSCWSPVTEGFAETGKYRQMAFRGRFADRTRDIEKMIDSNFYAFLKNASKAPGEKALKEFPQYEQDLKRISGSGKHGDKVKQLITDMEEVKKAFAQADPDARALSFVVKNVPDIERRYEDLYFRFMLDSLFE